MSVAAAPLPVSAGRSPARARWFRSKWFVRLYLGLFVLGGLVGIASEVSPDYFLGQTMLFCSVWFSLKVLSNRPLLNPVQTFVLILFNWFGIAPIALGGISLLFGDYEAARYNQEIGAPALWLVAFGLPLYAVCAHLTLRYLERRNLCLRSLLPAGDFYSYRTLITFAAIGLSTMAVVQLLGLLGIQGISQTNFLGGTKTQIWWVGIISSFSLFLTFAWVGALTRLIMRWREEPFLFKALTILLVPFAMLLSLTSGSKGQFAQYAFVILVIWISKRQRIPSFGIALLVLLLLLFVTPIITAGRNLILMSHGVTATNVDRTRVIVELMGRPDLWKPTLSDVPFDVLFRGIYPLAGETVRRSTPFEGGLEENTVWWGFLTMVPNVLLPNKPTSNIGNYFSRTIGAEMGLTQKEDEFNNIAISIPIEIVGNFGWLWGLLGFAFIGMGWAWFCGWFLSVSRLNSHPLFPYLIYLTLSFETSVGSFLSGIRDLLIVLLGLAVVRLLNPRKRAGL